MFAFKPASPFVLINSEAHIFGRQISFFASHRVAKRHERHSHPLQQRRLPTPIDSDHKVKPRLKVKMSIFVATKIL
ncbi:hypothetical protein PSCICG_30010 [Pseudomonas cichorii]|nr:hypothetical protein PSCICG_30010 [Pseudomonas cichorii]